MASYLVSANLSSLKNLYPIAMGWEIPTLSRIDDTPGKREVKHMGMIVAVHIP